MLCLICCLYIRYKGSISRDEYNATYRTCNSWDGIGRYGSGIYDLSGYENFGNKVSSKGHIGVPVFQGSINNNWNTSKTTTPTIVNREQSRKLVLYSGIQSEPISKYISFKEATDSKTARAYGISNIPNATQLSAMRNLGSNLFDKVREHFKVPLFISSFFRSPQLNKKVGGAVYSDHMALSGSSGLDIDMDNRTGPTNTELFFYIKNNLRFYKLIAEFPKGGKPGWVHISYSENELKNNERNVFIAVSSGGRTRYLPYKGNEYLIK